MRTMTAKSIAAIGLPSTGLSPRKGGAFSRSDSGGLPLGIAGLAVLWLLGCGGTRLDAGQVLELRTSLAHPEIAECSGLVVHQGAFWTHNDSGSRPVLYRSATLDFADAEVLELPAARAVDWEEIATFRGDLLVCDIGDNARRRDLVYLYQVHYEPGQGGRPGYVQLVAEYPFAYEDGPHDAEACFSLDDTVYIVTKNRGEGTLVMRFDELLSQAELMAGGVNVPRLVGELQIGPEEMVTAATVSPDGRQVVLLTYSSVLVYDADRLEGKPRSTTRIWARQAEAICFDGDRLIIANEQRDVFEVPAFLDDRPASVLPPRGAVRLLDGEPLQNLVLHHARDGEYVSWSRRGSRVRIQGRVALDHAPEATAADPVSLGTAVLLMWGREPRRFTTDEERVLVLELTPTAREVAAGLGGLARTEAGRPLWRLTQLSGTPELEPFAGSEGHVWTDDFGAVFEIDLDLARVFSNDIPDEALFDLKMYQTRAGDEPYLSGADLFAIERPYVWANVRLETKNWGR